MSIADAQRILQHLNSLDLSNPASHRDALDQAQSLVKALKDPAETAMDNIYCFTTSCSLYAMNSLGVFKKLSAAQGPVTATQLGEQTGGDPLLIARLMRSLTANDIVDEVGPQTYAANEVTRIYSRPGWEAGLRFSSGVVGVIQRFPEYLKQVNYRNPDSSVQPGPFQYCLETDLSTFEWIGQRPETAADFNLFMTQHRPQDWTETFSVPDNLFSGVSINENAPLVVDVAGGYGHDLRRVKSRALAAIPSARKGQFVLEDQASVIDTVPGDLQDADIEYVKHDFFTPQPVKGARVYTLKSILHDWADDKALAILRNIASAMQPGYSKIWILDGIVPETKASLGLVGMDIVMMMFLCALERTVKQWESLLDQAGLVITGLHERADGFGVVEAMLK